MLAYECTRTHVNMFRNPNGNWKQIKSHAGTFCAQSKRKETEWTFEDDIPVREKSMRKGNFSFSNLFFHRIQSRDSQLSRSVNEEFFFVCEKIRERKSGINLLLDFKVLKVDKNQHEAIERTLRNRTCKIFCEIRKISQAKLKVKRKRKKKVRD